MKKRRVVILGSTGSIGTSALKVARDIPERMEVVGLAANHSVEELAAQAREFEVKKVALYDPSRYQELVSLLPSDVEVVVGPEGLLELATLEEADLVLVSIVGTAGLHPALAAVQSGKDLAVASKEILVMAGEVVMSSANQHGVTLLPVDSEHNAIFQCLDGHRGGVEEVSRIILTASGGPFRQRQDLSEVTVAEALKHPTWEMGQKITIDSSTLFNKGLEMIEARWLFGVPMSKVDVVVHPQSIVHSMVEFRDSSILAQLSTTDMCFAIQYAITWPERVQNTLPPLDFPQLAQLTFEEPRHDDFPALRLAREAGEKGGTLPAVLNAANEVAVAAFVAGKLSYQGISRVVEESMAAHIWEPSMDLDTVIRADEEARRLAQELI